MREGLSLLRWHTWNRSLCDIVCLGNRWGWQIIITDTLFDILIKFFGYEWVWSNESQSSVFTHMDKYKNISHEKLPNDNDFKVRTK